MRDSEKLVYLEKSRELSRRATVANINLYF